MLNSQPQDHNRVSPVEPRGERLSLEIRGGKVYWRFLDDIWYPSQIVDVELRRVVGLKIF